MESVIEKTKIMIIPCGEYVPHAIMKEAEVGHQFVVEGVTTCYGWKTFKTDKFNFFKRNNVDDFYTYFYVKKNIIHKRTEKKIIFMFVQKNEGKYYRNYCQKMSVYDAN